jgi:hypothetical protein
MNSIINEISVDAARLSILKKEETYKLTKPAR